MIDKETMRKRDFITSLVLICASIGIMIIASRMPMKGIYGGVQNEWYVSPALLPLIIGGGLLILSIILLINSIVSKGAKGAIDDIVAFVATKRTSHTKNEPNEAVLVKQISQFRVFLVVVEFFILIFLFIPRVDFLISLIFFLLSIMGMFYLDRVPIILKIGKILIVGAVVMSIVSWTTLDTMLIGLFEFSLDILVFFLTVAIYLLLRKEAVKEIETKKKLRTVTIIAIVVPLIVTCLFRYALLVPLPVEGLFFDRICNSIYYAIR